MAALIADDGLPERSGFVAGWLVDEWGRESFPASDPPARWAGADRVAAGARV